jgi:hypothetical protein
MGNFVEVKNKTMNNFTYCLEFKFGKDCELDYLGDNQMWNWFEFLGAFNDL